MYIQKIIENNQIDTAELYIRKNDNIISYNTYFNCLSYSQIIKYLGSNKCNLSFKYKGRVTFQVRCKSKKNDIVIYSEDLQSDIFSTYKSKDIDLSKLDKDGYIYPCFINFDKEFISSDIQYEVDSKEKDITIIIVITTYKREDYIRRNIEKLRLCKSFIKNVIVVDNGKTLNDIASDDYIKIIPNDNTGGSGGFKRGMIEAKHIGCSHIYLMDDDISFHIETIERAYNFMKNLSDNHKDDWLGFSMIINDKPTIQNELGGYWNGVKVKMHPKDLLLEKTLLDNSKLKHCDYSAWWSLIMPVTVINKYGLPLPFFIKFDDIEYSLRNKEEIILSNGFGVWHDDFVYKRNMINVYCEMRNSFITNSLHIKQASFKSLIRFSGQYIKGFLKFNYEKLNIINKAVNDYLKGPVYFKEISKLNIKEYLENDKEHNHNLFINFFIYIFLFPIYFFKLIFKYRKAQKEYLLMYNTKDSYND